MTRLKLGLALSPCAPLRCISSPFMGQNTVDFLVELFLLYFCNVVPLCDLVLDVEAIFHLRLLLTSSGNLF